MSASLFDDDQPALTGALQDAAFEIGSEYLGKKGENMKVNGRKSHNFILAARLKADKVRGRIR